MESIVLLARVVLAGVFATAGAAKLLDQSGSRSALAEFGAPQRTLAAGALLLPLAELAAAIALVLRPTAQVGAAAALVLLLMFVAAIAAALTQGKAPDCHCFGQVHSAPAGRGTLARNAALAVPAVLVLAEGPGPSIDTWVADRAGAELAAIGFAAAAVLLGTAALRQWQLNRGLRRALDDAETALAHFPPGLPVGARAPSFSLPSVHGGTVTLESLLAAGRPVALAFVAPGCGPCERLIPNLGRWQSALASDVTIAVISSGSREENLAAIQSEVADVLLQMDHEVMDRYRIGGTPAATVVAPDGTIASGMVSGASTTESLIRLTVRRHTPEPAPGGGLVIHMVD